MDIKLLDYKDIIIIDKCLDKLIMPTEDEELCNNFVRVHSKIKAMISERKLTLHELKEKLNRQDEASGHAQGEYL